MKPSSCGKLPVLLLLSGAALLPLRAEEKIAVQPEGSGKPNILFILADDLGIDALHCFGSDQYATPHLDALAAGGMKFTHTYASPLCGPSRALILTGRYAFRTGATNQDKTGQFTPEQETMMPKILKPEGYASAMIGKWGQLPLTPSDFGFDEYLTFKGSGIYWNTQAKGKEYTRNGQQVELKDQEYMPDLMHGLAVDFITRNQDKPFYLYYSMSHIHTEILPTPDSQEGADKKQLYADNIAYMDKLVGQLVTELGRLKLREKTLIVFVGDNGTAKGGAEMSTVGGKKIFGSKGSMMEGGSLVPMIVNWPGTTPAGKDCPDPIDFSDFVPTFAAAAGAKLPEGVVIDGKSFLPQIQGEKGTPREWAFVQLARMWYVRSQNWKLNEKGELYDMSGAPFEEKLVPADSTDPTAVAERAKLKAALDKLNPAGGILDDGDGTGRHSKNREKKPKKAKKDQSGDAGSDPSSE
jgi:arylsulfatase A